MEKIKKLIQSFNQEEVVKSFMGASYCRDLIWKGSKFVSAKMEMILACTLKESESSLYFSYDDFNNIKNAVDTYFNKYENKFIEEAIRYSSANEDSRKNKLVESITQAKYLFYRKEGYTILVLEFGKRLFNSINPQIKKICGFDYNDLEKVYLYISQTYVARLVKLMKELEQYRDSDKWNNYAFESLKRNIFNIDKEELYKLFDKKIIDNILNEYSQKQFENRKYESIFDFNDYAAHPILNYENHIIIPDIRYGIANLPKLFNYTMLSVANNLEHKYPSDECKKLGKDYSQVRGDNIENYVVECFNKAFGSDAKIYRSLKYGKDKTYEADVTVVYNKFVIICECKGKLMTLSALQGNLDNIKKDFELGIQKAYDQCCRTEDYIIQEKELYNNSEAVNIDKESTVVKMCITAENFGFIASCPIFLLDNVKDEKFPIIYSVYDLAFVTDQLKEKELINYLIQRQKYSSGLLTIEEADNVCTYLRKNKNDVENSYLSKYQEYLKDYII